MKPSLLSLSLFAALGAASLAAGCAAGPRPRTESAQTRVPDSVPEKIAAQRAANPNLRLEQEDQRWGISAAKERQADQKARKQVPDGTSASGTGRVDVAPRAPATGK
jgi:hypothetical protein